MNYKELIASRIHGVIDIENQFAQTLLEVPPKSEMGDFAFPCFRLAKILKKSPNIIADEIAKKIDKDLFEKVEVLGPYVNFFLDKGLYSKEIIEKVLSEKENYGKSSMGNGRNITIDYSSPNIAKPFHIGHLFSTVIGSALYKMYSSQGYNPIGINHLGDWGTQFGKLISAYNRWVDEGALEEDPIKELLRIYVKFHDEAEKNPELEDEGRDYFTKLENKDEEATTLWKRFRELSLREFDRVYKMLGVSFDSYAGESFYSDKMDSIVQEIKDKDILVESNGALVVNLEEYNMPPCIVIKSNGATIYATRDLAAANYRKENYDFEKSIYVVGKDQSLYFKQLFKVLELAGKDWAKDCHHVAFGLVRFADQKLSTRKGNVIFLEDLLNQAVEKTLNIINTKNPNLENKEEAAKKIGIGAVMFTYLKNSREKDIVFDWDEMLSFEGETGPYVQYTYARANSVLKKLSDVSDDVDFSMLKTKEEFELVKSIAGFRESIVYALEKLEPSIVTRQIIETSKLFNKFYNNCPITNAEDKVKKVRLALLKGTMIVIENGLSLLGIEVVDKM